MKNIAKVILPKNLLKKNEQFFRSLIAKKYKGDKQQCILCDYNLEKFIELKTGDLLCPRCGSNGRARGLWILLKDLLIGKRVLHFSPPSRLKTKIEELGKTSKYFCTDYVGEFQTDNQVDIQNIEMADWSFDLIICFHVLEHVEDDRAALRELYRVLAEDGQCFIQTPYQEGEIYEDDSIQSEEGRLEHFGQKDHLRIYSVSGLKARMEEVGFKVELIRSEEPEGNYFGLKTEDIVLQGRK